MAICAQLPEVVRVSARDDRGVVDITWIRLELADGSTIVIYGLSEDGHKCRRTRLADDDYSDRAVIELITADMKQRLMSVFGPLRFDGE
jgi:hypothetical protein